MANAKISAQAAASALMGSEILGGVQSGGNVGITAQQVKDLCLALTSEVGRSQMLYDDDGYNTVGLSTNALIAASNSQVAMMGQLWHPDRTKTTFDITKVHVRVGAMTEHFATGTVVRVSLQDWETTLGPPYRPDGVQDQFYDFKTANTVLTANAWQSTGALSANRTVDLSAVNYGDVNSRWVAAVFEFGAGGFVGGESIVLNSRPFAITMTGDGGNVIMNTAGAGYAALAARVSNVAFECTDGTFAFFNNSSHWSNVVTSTSVGNAAAIRRIGVKFKVPTRRKLEKFGMIINFANGHDGSYVLYGPDGTTVLASVNLDNDALLSLGGSPLEVMFPPVTIEANTYYRIAWVPSTSITATVSYNEVNSLALMDGLVHGRNAFWTQHDGTNWDDTHTTRRPNFALGFSHFLG